MSQLVKIEVPDIGDFDEVEVIEILVEPGASIEPEETLITLESDKASMDVPSTVGGTVREMHVKLGDRVSAGDSIATIETDTAEASESEDSGTAKESKSQKTGTKEKSDSEKPDAPPADAKKTKRAEPASGQTRKDDGSDRDCEVLVLGAGPGGYTAAFRAADLGLDTVLVERYDTLGGVCLNVGCIPSKALLHTAEVVMEVKSMGEHGVVFGEPSIDVKKLGTWKDSIVGKLTKGLAGLAKQRKVRVITGKGQFTGANQLRIEGRDGTQTVRFDKAVIAAGSQATRIPGFPDDDPRLMDSTDALTLSQIPERLLIVGGGIIGLEMAAVYHALGAKITVVELLDGLVPGCDRDLIRPLQKRIEKLYENIFLSTKVSAISAEKSGLKVSFEGDKAPAEDVFDAVLVAVGRRPNGDRIGAEQAGVKVDERGFIAVDRQQRTNVPHIFAIGDIVGQPMLAHKATHEGKVAAEVCAGMKSSFDAAAIPNVAYTDPEVAWTGLTETQCKEQGVDYEKGVFPWAASGRALGIGRDEGITKVLFDKEHKRVIGAGIVGPHAGDLIAEATLALEMGTDVTDLSLTIHPHPTLSETLNFAAEMVEGTITDLYAPKKKK